MKSILVALDATPSGNSAQKLGIDFAKFYKATLSGIYIPDEQWTFIPEPDQLEEVDFKVVLNEQLLSDELRQINHLKEDFIKHCKNQNVTCSIVNSMGIPSYKMEDFLIEHDLLIVGKDEKAHFNPTQEITIPIRELVKHGTCPVMVVGPNIPYPTKTDVLVAFDGSFVSARAIHMALLMSIFKGKTAHIASASDDIKKAQNYMDTIAKLFQNYGVNTHFHPIISSEAPSDALLRVIEKVKPFFLVMGAYGHGGISHFFGGSCVENLLKFTNVPIFFFR